MALTPLSSSFWLTTKTPDQLVIRVWPPLVAIWVLFLFVLFVSVFVMTLIERNFGGAVVALGISLMIGRALSRQLYLETIQLDRTKELMAWRQFSVFGTNFLK